MSNFRGDNDVCKALVIHHVCSILATHTGPEPTVSQETDITTSRLEKLASRLDQRSEPYLITQIEKGVVTKLCNSLNRLVRLPTLSEQEMEVQYAGAWC